MMALGNTLGTTIDGGHKGAGMTKMQGEISRVQYYYESQSWIHKTYFSYRGLDDLGFTKNQSQEVEEIELSGSIDLDNTVDKTVIDFDDQHVEIDTRKDQKFEEI